jgi:hypothetical protein
MLHPSGRTLKLAVPSKDAVTDPITASLYVPSASGSVPLVHEVPSPARSAAAIVAVVLAERITVVRRSQRAESGTVREWGKLPTRLSLAT